MAAGRKVPGADPARGGRPGGLTQSRQPALPGGHGGGQTEYQVNKLSLVCIV